MNIIKRSITFLLITIMVISLLPMNASKVLAATSYVSASKTVNPSSILVGEETEITLNIQGTPPVNVVKPNDVILIIDRSGSMGTEKMNSAKNAAKGFIDLMDFTKHQVGIVDFSTNVGSFNLTTDKQSAKSYVDTLIANGSTNTGSAIQKATELLANHRSDAQPVIVLLTDGEATGAGDGLNAFDYTLKKAQEAKDAGIVFYTIALLNATDNPDSSSPNILMKNMATTAHHHHFILGSVGLSEIYAAIVQEIGLASAYDVIVKDVVADGFEIVPGSYNNNIPKPVVSGNTLTWNFLELKKDVLSFTYKVRHTGLVAGTFPVSKGSVITYKDYTGASRTYDIPVSNVVVKYPAPVITSVTPNKGHILGGETIVIEGANFLPNVKVRIGGSYSTSVNLISDKKIEFIVPSGIQGENVLSVINPDGQSASDKFFYYANPEVSKLEPSSGPLSGGTKLLITGKYFMNGVKVKVGENYSPTVTYNTTQYITAITPQGAQPGLVDVTLENPDGTFLVVKGAFTYNEPPKLELKSLSPSQGYTSGNETVVLTGQLFEATSKVFFGDTPAASVTFVNQGTLSVKTPVSLQEATVDVKVLNADGTSATLPQAYKYILPPPPNAPTITSVSPNSGPMEGGTIVYVEGKDFVTGAKVTIKNDTDSKEAETTFVSGTRLKVKMPAWSKAEIVNFNVINPDLQTNTLLQAFTYLAPPAAPAPTVTSSSPNHGPLEGTTIIYVDGSNFKSGAKMFFVTGGQEIDLNATYVSTTRMKATTPAYTTAGPLTIKVVNPDNQSGELVNAFIYDAPPVYPDPVVTSISPNSGNKLGGYTVEIAGTDFRPNATVKFGSTVVPLSGFVSPTLVRVKAPAAAVAGSVDVTLTNPDGKSSTVINGFTYELDKPSIRVLTPGNGPMAGGTIVYLDGSFFESGLTLKFNNAVIPYDYISSSRVKFKTPSASVPGAVNVEIINPSGLSASSTFTYDAPPAIPAPKITSVSPGYGPVSGGTIIYIDGSSLQQGSKIIFNGVQYDATFVTTTRVKFKTPAMAAAGVVTFKIINPDGQESGYLNFEYR
ncbi:IPT/TIG domain-containing protein [Paenibacillus sp. RC84]|uniref:IPT/TIG domain-containing protein n=1 Tax=Paenibacillus sp. RC84 TaxID=3156252 RepID=UPI0035110D97